MSSFVETQAHAGSSRTRKWVFTLNNYTDLEMEELARLETTYLVYGKEVGESGTPHLQGCLFFKSVKSLSQLTRVLPRAHFEPMMGTPQQAIEYCKKDGDWIETGTPPMTQKEKGECQKKRYQRAWELAKTGGDDWLDDIDADIRMRHYATLKRIRRDYQQMPESLNTLDNHWYVGPSGAGKSKKATDENPGHYRKMTSKVWWDGYRGEDVVIIDDLGPNSVNASDLKQWADHYPFRAEVKGDSMLIRPKKIIVTSNHEIREVYPFPQDYEPMERRFKVTRWE